MTVGNQPTASSVSSQMSALAVTLRNTLRSVSNLFESLQAIGSDNLTAGLEAIGFNSTDATTAETLLSYMNTIVGVYEGTVQQGGTGGTGATEFDFDNALSVLWGGL